VEWTWLGPASFSLAGVALGSVGSLFGVYHAQRSTREHMRLQQTTLLRAERRETFLEYLGEFENSWAFLQASWGNRPVTSTQGDVLIDPAAIAKEAVLRQHDIWSAYQKVALVAGEECRRIALELNHMIYKATYHREDIDQTLFDYLAPSQEAFLAAARRELRLDLDG